MKIVLKVGAKWEIHENMKPAYWMFGRRVHPTLSKRGKNARHPKLGGRGEELTNI